MKKIALIIIVLFLFISFLNAKVLFKIPWGKGKGELGFYNKTFADYNEMYPLGPQSIKFYVLKVWILDSFNKKILVYSLKGKLKEEYSLKGIEGFINDFAYSIRNKKIYIVSEEGIYVYSLKTKKLEKWHLSRGEGKGSFLDPRVISVKYNKVAVFDKMKEKVIVFSEKNKSLLGEYPVGKGGFVFWRNSIYFVRWNEEGYKLFRYDLRNNGKLKYLFNLGLKNYAYGTIIGIRKGKLLFHAYNLKRRKRISFLFDILSQTILERKEYPIISPEENIFYFTPFGKELHLKFDAGRAPKGKVKVVLENTYQKHINIFPFKEREISRLKKNLFQAVKEKVISLKYLEDSLFVLTTTGIYKNKKLELDFKKVNLKDEIVDFYYNEGYYYLLRGGVKGGEILRYNISTGEKVSFPPYVEEEPLFTFPYLLTGYKDGLMVKDPYAGREAYFDGAEGKLLGVTSGLEQYLLFGYGYLLRLRVEGKKYYFVYQDNLGNVMKEVGPFETDKKIVNYSLWRDGAGNIYLFLSLKDKSILLQKFNSDYQLLAQQKISYFLPPKFKKIAFGSKGEIYFLLKKMILKFQLPF